MSKLSWICLIGAAVLLAIFWPAPLAVANAREAAAPLALILTSTPGADGSIIHVVQTEESLASIAESYGITIGALVAQNGLASNTGMIFPGQRLIILPPQPPTETPTFTPTVPRPTRTPTPFIPTRTPRPTLTGTPTPLPSPTTDPMLTSVNNLWETNRTYLLYAMIAICGLGLILTLWTGFRK